MEDLLTAAHAADLLGMHPNSVRKAASLGVLKGYRPYPRVLLFPRDEVERYARERQPRGRPAKPPPPKPPTHEERIAHDKALLAAHPELTEIAVDREWLSGQPRIAGTRIPADMAATSYRASRYDRAVTQQSYKITQEQADQVLAWAKLVAESGDG